MTATSQTFLQPSADTAPEDNGYLTDFHLGSTVSTAISAHRNELLETGMWTSEQVNQAHDSVMQRYHYGINEPTPPGVYPEITPDGKLSERTKGIARYALEVTAEDGRRASYDPAYGEMAPYGEEEITENQRLARLALKQLLEPDQGSGQGPWTTTEYSTPPQHDRSGKQPKRNKSTHDPFEKMALQNQPPRLSETAAAYAAQRSVSTYEGILIQKYGPDVLSGVRTRLDAMLHEGQRRSISNSLPNAVPSINIELNPKEKEALLDALQLTKQYGHYENAELRRVRDTSPREEFSYADYLKMSGHLLNELRASKEVAGEVIDMINSDQQQAVQVQSHVLKHTTPMRMNLQRRNTRGSHRGASQPIMTTATEILKSPVGRHSRRKAKV